MTLALWIGAIAWSADVVPVCELATTPTGHAGIFDDRGALYCGERHHLKWVDRGSRSVQSRDIQVRFLGEYGDKRKTFVDPHGVAWVGYWAGKNSMLASKTTSVPGPWDGYDSVARTQRGGSGCWGSRTREHSLEFHWNGSVVDAGMTLLRPHYCDDEVALIRVFEDTRGKFVIRDTAAAATWELPQKMAAPLVGRRATRHHIYMTTKDGVLSFPLDDTGMKAAARAVFPQSTPQRLRGDLDQDVHLVFARNGPEKLVYFFYPDNTTPTIVDLTAALKDEVVSDIDLGEDQYCMSVQRLVQEEPPRTRIGRFCAPLPSQFPLPRGSRNAN